MIADRQDGGRSHDPVTLARPEGPRRHEVVRTRLVRLATRVARAQREAGAKGIVHAVARRVTKWTATSVAGTEAASPLAGALDWLSGQARISIVQIGAYVGDTANDPLFSFLRREFATPDRAAGGSVAVLVEPVKEYFDRLQENCRGLTGVKLENVAIAEEAGTREFYRLAADPTAYGLPSWLSQLGSLTPDRMTRLWEGYEKDSALQEFWLANRVTEEVRCLTLDDLLQLHGISDLDLLQIDAEGYDYQILRTIDFDRLRPRFINYERVLLQDDEERCANMLRQAGYLLLDWGQDTFCIRMG